MFPPGMQRIIRSSSQRHQEKTRTQQEELIYTLLRKLGTLAPINILMAIYVIQQQSQQS